LILTAILYNLRSSKIIASSSFTKKPYLTNLLQKAIDSYYTLLESGSNQNFTALHDNKEGAIVCKVNDLTILIGFGQSSMMDDTDLNRMKSLAKEIGSITDKQAFREARQNFDTYFHKTFGIDLFCCFFSSPNPSKSDKSGTAIAELMEHQKNTGFPFTKPLAVGPYRISIMHASFEDIPSQEWSVFLKKIDVFAIIISKKQPTLDGLRKLVDKIRSNSPAKILVIPSSDDLLEETRAVESSLELFLCDSVVETPSYLLVSVLATSGRLDMPPDLAVKNLVINKKVDTPISQIRTEKDVLGHQAFFVIDKLLGESVFEYYYTDEPKISRNISNVVAAVSMFKLDSTLPTATSVFQTGDLKYAIIEREGLLFTLITGQSQDAESIRTKFAYLPDLFLESRPPKIENPDDLYTFPPFTLKLLATVPPYEWPRELIPSRLNPPEWNRFESDWMNEFLRTVWLSIDGSKTIDDLQTDDGPGMVLGALHFLKRIGAIEGKFRVFPNYIPVLLEEVDSTTKGLYSGLNTVIDYIDGKHTIGEIALACGIDQNVLITVFTELQKRGLLQFKINRDTSPKAS
jgi:hypothetical protein